jgi:hypothetical protein
MKNILKKQKNHAFGKDIYLLGENESGKRYWLEAPIWDCSWYWCFGYVETYTNNCNPEKSNDISSHQHIDSSFMGQQEKGECISNIYDAPKLSKTTFTKDEGWELSELFKQFYLLQEMAAFCHKKPAGCHVTTVAECDHGDLSEWYDKINKIMMPRVTSLILKILSPID